MPKYHDQIFNEYAKLALEKGLVKTAKESKQLKKYKKDDYPRVGSDKIEVIEKLYNVKPDSPKSMQYEKNIAEVAHPEKEIIFPAYDRFNTLVENINERQRILLNIVNKPVNGLHTQHRYAQSELAASLVRIANDLDNRDMNDLRVLADTCFDQLRKKAIAPLVIAGIAAVVLGAVYLYNHVNDADRGLSANIDHVLGQLDSLIGEDWFHQTFYAELKPSFRENLAKFRSDLTKLKAAVSKFNEIRNHVESLKTLDELQKVAEESGEDIKVKAEQFKAILDEVAPEIVEAITLFQRSDIRSMAIEKDTWFSQMMGGVESYLHGGLGLFADRFDDVKHALAPLESSIRSTYSTIDELEKTQEKRQVEVANALQAQESHQGPTTTVKSPVETPKEPAAEEGLGERLEKVRQEMGLT